MTEADQLSNQSSLETSAEQILVVDIATNEKVPLPKLIEKLGKDAQKALNDAADAKTIVILGFFIVAVMVATMLISVLTLFIQAVKDNGSSSTSHHGYYQTS